MVALPAADIELLRLPSPAEQQQQQKKKKKKPINMTTLFNKFARAGLSHTDPSLQSSAEEEEEEQEFEVQKVEHPLISCTHSSYNYPTHHTTYSLSSVPLTSLPSTASSSCCSSTEIRSKQQYFSPSSSSSTISASHHGSLKGDQHHIISSLPSEFPVIHPSDHMKTLLSQLASSISALKSAFARLKASPLVCGNIVAEKAMAEELQRLSELHMRLYSLYQQQDSCVYETSSNESNYMGQDAMLKSYEGIICRFHDEIRKKDAVTEALKETLAKSMLKGEKLERRMKALEAKLITQNSFRRQR